MSGNPDLEAWRAKLLAERAALQESSSATADSRSPVTLDQQSVGRLSRMDALQVPALAHRGLIVVQSNIILDYLARETGCFLPNSEQDQWRAREWLSWEADAITNVAKVRHYNRFRKGDPAVMDYFTPLAESALDVVNAALEGRDWLVGEACSIADLGCWGRMVFMAEGGLEITRWPNIEAWSKRIAAMPGTPVSSVARCGPAPVPPSIPSI